jgi:import inner membrane translocase subunit TIM44
MLRRGTRRLARGLGQPTVSAARGKGFFGNFRDSLKKEMEKNKELQETLKSLREDETLAKAREAAKKAAAGVQKAAQTAGSSASSAAEQAGARASSAASQAAQMAEEARAKAGFSASDSGADGSSKASAEQTSGAKPAGGPSFFDQLRDRLSGLFGGGANAAPARGQGDPNSTEVIVKEPSFWEKTFNFASESPFGRFGAVFGDAAGGVGDRIFGETEQAEALRELREIMPDFDMDTFLATEVVQKQKEVLGAYLRGDMEALRRTCRDAAYGALHKSVMERQAHQLMVRCPFRLLPSLPCPPRPPSTPAHPHTHSLSIHAMARCTSQSWSSRRISSW